MITPGHCDACTIYARACRNNPGAFDDFVSLCRTVIGQADTDFMCQPQIVDAWFNDLQSHLSEDVVPPDACVIEWAIDRLKVYANDPQRELVALWYAGDAQAFERLYMMTRVPLVSKATRVVGSEAEDLVETFFVELYESWAQGLPMYMPYRGAFLSYAFRCIIRRAYTHSSRTKRQHDIDEQRLESLQAQTNGASYGQEFTLDVLKIVDATPLDADERAALELSADGWAGEEIAETLSTSPATVTRRLASAFAKLANQLREVAPPDQLMGVLRELTMNHKQRAAAVFLHYALREIDYALREAGIETFIWPTKYEAASLCAAELYHRLAMQSEDHPVCPLILKHAVEPWGIRLWDALGSKHATNIMSAQGEI